MTRYFFDLEDGKTSRDEEGTELDDRQGALLEAVKLLGQELCDRGASFWENPDLKLTVRDDTDLTLMRLTVFGTLAPASR